MRFDRKTIESAKKMVEQKRVLNAVKYKSSKVWFAEVLDGTQLYDVYLDTQDVKEDSCQCYHFSQHHFCKHSVAVELYLHVKGYRLERQNNKEDELLQSPRLSQLLNQQIKKLYDMTFKQEDAVINNESTLQLDVTLQCPMTTEQPFECFFHIVVQDKRYKIKSMASFIDSYHFSLPFKVSTTQQIDWNIETLNKPAHECLQHLFQLKQMHPTLFAGRQHVLPHRHLMSIMPYFSRLNLTVYQNNQLVKYIPTTQHLHFHIEENQTDLKLTWLDRTVFLYELSNGALAFVDGIMYPVNADDLAGYRLLSQLFESGKENVITIPMEDRELFLSDTLPFLQRFATFNADFLTRLSFEKPEITFHLDMADNRMQMKSQFHYSNAPLLVHDRSLEHYIERQLKRHGFHESMTFSTRADLLAFVFRKLPILEQFGQVHLPEHWQDKLIKSVEEPNIAIHQQGNLLDITFEMDGISQDDIDDILIHIQEKESVYEFSDGRVLNLEDEAFTKVHRILEKIRHKGAIKNGALQVSRLKVLQIVDDVKQVDDTLQKLIHDLRHPEQFETPLPQTLQATLKPYQVLGYQWLKMLSYHQLGGILGDDMGLGKTIQSIAYLLSEYENGGLRQKKALVIAPASLIFNWKKECTQFAPSLPIAVVHGSRKEREQLLQGSENTAVIITSYQSFRQDSAFYQSKLWQTLILDESQMVKNYTTKMHHELRDVQAEFMFALSGTPIENRKEDFWSIYSLLLPGLFPALKAYRAMSESDIARTAQPFLLRRLKKDVLGELPDKLETTMYSELTKEQKVLYMGYLQRIQEQVSGYSLAEMNKKRIEILTGLMRLKQICCHPSLFVESYDGQSGKLNQFIELVDNCIKSGRRLLVFSQFASMLPLLEHALNKKAYQSFQLTGQTPVKERLNIVQAFNHGEKDILLMSLKAGGTGLNLTSADTIILYDLWWNPAVEEQAMGRAHRLGQKRTVQVYRLVADGTIEERIMQLQQRKKELFDSVVTHERDDVFQRHELTNDDIKEILGIG